MLITTDSAGHLIRWQRENWRERFRFPVMNKFFKKGIPIPPNFKATHYVGSIDSWWFWRTELAGLVKAYLITRTRWFDLARRAYLAGYIKPGRREFIGWSWPLLFLKRLWPNTTK